MCCEIYLRLSLLVWECSHSVRLGASEHHIALVVISHDEPNNWMTLCVVICMNKNYNWISNELI